MLQNRGTGAGGENTNKSGKSHEEKTHLSSFYTYSQNIKKITPKSYLSKVSFGYNEFMNIEQGGFAKYLKPKSKLGHGCKKPDEMYIDENNKIIFWIEKKNQNGSGSVSEKLQGAPFKKKNLKENYPDYDIEYIFILNDFFKNNHEAELNYLKEENIPVFFSDELERVIKYINLKSIECEVIKSLIALKLS